MKVVHILRVENGELVFVGSRVSDSMSYTPAQAVAILKKFPTLVITVPITHTSVKELQQRWFAQDGEEVPTALDKLKAAYLNQSSDMLFLPREVVGQLIEEMVSNPRLKPMGL